VTYNRAHRRGVRAVLVLAALTAAALLAPTGASALSEQADTGTWGAHGRVLAMVRLGNTMFIGGRFDRVQSPDGKTRIAADNLAAIDLTTGQPVQGFQGGVGMSTTAKPQVDSLAVSADGTRLFVGGKFDTVDGQPQSFFTALSPQTGAIDTTFQGARFSGAVHAILVGPSRIYVGGAFKKIDGKSHPYLAALMPGGSLDTQWVSKPDNLVRSLTPSGDWSTIFVGGLFVNVDAQSRISVARVSAATGSLDPWTIPAGTIDPPQTAWDIVVDGSVVYIGFGHGPNYMAAFRLDNGDSGDQVWRLKTQGNVEGLAMAPDRSRLFFSGHFGTGALNQRVCNGPFLRGLASVDPATGTIICDWIPQITPFGNNYVGVWVIDIEDGALWAGGKITTVGGVTHLGFARFTLNAI